MKKSLIFGMIRLKKKKLLNKNEDARYHKYNQLKSW